METQQSQLSPWKILSGLAWLGILVPLCVENYWDISFGHYDLRFQYLAVAFLMLVFASRLPQSAEARKELRQYLSQPFVWALGVLLLVGLLGFFHTANPKRLFFIWLWSAGTFLSLPFVVSSLYLQWGAWLTRSLATGVAFHSLIVIADFILCALKSNFHLARVFIQGGSCRPHAWYREPGFFAVFMVSCLIWLRIALQKSQGTWKNFYLGCYLISATGILLCTSRMGWAALALILGIEIFCWLRKAWRRGLKLELKKTQNLALIAIAVIVLSVGLHSFSKTRSYRYTSESIQRVFKGTDGSLLNRRMNMDALITGFKDHPLVGVGPGTIGAYLVAHHPDHPALHAGFGLNDGFSVTKDIPRNQRLEIAKNVSYSNSVAGEMLAEWGLLGVLSLLCAWFLMFRQVTGVERWQLVAAGILLCITWQTVQRFDMWLSISMIWLLSQNKKELA